MFRKVPLSIIRSFSLYTQQWYMPYRFADSLRANCQLASFTRLYRDARWTEQKKTASSSSGWRLIEGVYFCIHVTYIYFTTFYITAQITQFICREILNMMASERRNTNCSSFRTHSLISCPFKVMSITPPCTLLWGVSIYLIIKSSSLRI